MKYFLITLTFLLFMSGCSYQTAFSKFNMTKEEQLLAANTQSSKIESKNGIDGVFTAIYLNNVYKKTYFGDDYFFVSVYMKNPKTLYDFKLNENLAKETRKIEGLNEFTALMKSKEKWNRYYLVSFKSTKKKINLVLFAKEFSSAQLHYLKDL